MTPVATAARFADIPAFIQELAFDDLPGDVVALAQHCVLDLTGVAAAGSRAPGAAIANAYAVHQLAGRDRGGKNERGMTCPHARNLSHGPATRCVLACVA